MYAEKYKIKRLGHAALYLESIVSDYEFVLIREAHDACVIPIMELTSVNNVCSEIEYYQDQILQLAD